MRGNLRGSMDSFWSLNGPKKTRYGMSSIPFFEACQSEVRKMKPKNEAKQGLK